MIIAIDGYEANTAHRVGIGQYAFQLIKNIYQLVYSSRFTVHRKIQFRIYLPDQPLKDMPKETDRWQYRVIKPKKLWTYIGLPAALKKDLPRADIIFSPTHYSPRFTGMKKAMSIMDLSYLKFPELFRFKDIYQLRYWTRYSAARADCIFTISQSSKNDIIKTYRKDKEQIVVTYPGINMSKATNLPGKNRVFDKYKISKNYILSVGTIQPRKNYLRLMDAFRIFLSENRQLFSNIQLIIVGKKGWMYEEILDKPRKIGLNDRIKFLDYVSDSDLAVLYKNALCFALPSLYEGFGLPVAEAMSYGCPVVVSNVSSLPEVAGKAGIYVDPENPESIAKGLLDAVRQRNLMQGKLRVKHGLEQVKKYTWDKAAEDTLEALAELGEKK